MIWFSILSLWLLSFFTVVGLWIIYYYLSRRRYFELGNKLPGPKPWPLVGNLLYFGLKKPKMDLLGVVNHFTGKYGFTRFWLGHQLHVFVCNTEDAKVFFSSPDLLDRTDHFIQFMEPVFGKGLPTTNGTEWAENKRLMGPLFQYKSLIKGASIHQQKTDILIRLLEKEVDSNFSVYPYISRCMCDLSCGTFTGISIDLQEEGLIIHNQIEDFAKFTVQRAGKFWQHFDLIFQSTKAGKIYYKTLDDINNFVGSYIQTYKKAFLEEGQHFVEYNEENPDIKAFAIQKLASRKEEELRDFVVSTIGASLESTASAVSFALMMLGMHQDIQQKLYDEILSAAEMGFDDKEMRKLDYLDRVIKETLRLLPPLPLTNRKASGDIWFGQHLIPKGAAVTLSIFAIHRDPKHYETPNAFNPDHFLAEKVSKRDPYAYIPFSTGKRNCAGSAFAYMTMRLVLAKIIFHYRVECDMKLEDLELRFYIALKAKDLNYPIRLIKR